MSREFGFIQWPLIGTLLLGILLGIYLFASKRLPKRDQASSPVKHTVEKHPDEALHYWTAEKMRKAKPAKMPKTNDLEKNKQHSDS